MVRDGANPLPSAAAAVHRARGRGRKRRDGDEHSVVVDEADGETGVPGHRAVNDVLPEQGAIVCAGRTSHGRPRRVAGTQGPPKAQRPPPQARACSAAPQRRPGQAGRFTRE